VFEYDYTSERSIKWTRDPKKYAYLRECIVESISHDSLSDVINSLAYADGHIVGYTSLHTTTEKIHGKFQRRLWWARDFDRYIGAPKCQHLGIYSGPETHPNDSKSIESIVVGKPSQEWTITTNNSLTEYKETPIESTELEF